MAAKKRRKAKTVKKRAVKKTKKRKKARAKHTRRGKKRRVLSPILKELVEQGFNGEFKEEKIGDIERLALVLIKKFRISEDDVEKKLSKRGKREAMPLIELERKVKKEILYAPVNALLGVPSFERDRERALDLVAEVREHRIEFEK